MDGILIINKPKEYTSHDIVSVVKKITKTKVGHTGTLDPNATGVLPLLLGDATKISKYLINHDKVYEAVLQLGKKTTTADEEGEIVDEREVTEEQLNEDTVKKVLSLFIGKRQQVPPIYSAIKVKGKKLYEYARNGQEVGIEPREIEIYEMKLIQIQKEQARICFSVHCSKGTYIRTLCEDISQKLGSIGYMKELNREIVGEFSLNQAISIEELKQHQDEIQWLQNHIISIETLFENKEEIILEDKQYQPFLNGILLETKKADEVYRIYVRKEFLGLGVVSQGRLKRDVIIKK